MSEYNGRYARVMQSANVVRSYAFFANHKNIVTAKVIIAKKNK